MRARMLRVATVLLPMAISLAAHVRADDLDPEAVRRAIDRAVQFLERTQNDNGTWPSYTAYDTTGLCTLALLNAGVDPQADSIQRALAWLRKQPPTGVYEASLQTMVFCAAEPQRDLLLIQRNARWLEDQQIADGPMKGSWGYRGTAGGGDGSNAQFALLALYEAHRVGVTVSDQTWRRALAYWQNSQKPDGSWGYKPDSPGSGSMTCAGIGSMVIALGRLSVGDAEVRGERIDCCGLQEQDNRIERGLAWLGRNFSVDVNPGAGGYVLYYLYGMERVGRLTARRFIGEHDWYREGTEKLVAAQDSLAGLWKGAGHGENHDQVATSFALLFLAKGRRPVLMAKLKHGPDEDWNRHRSDAANLTAYVEGRWKRDLAWQTVDLEAATADDLLQSPVLYLSGERAPQIDEAGARKLREYIQRGGFVFAEACCQNGQQFDEGFRRLIEQVFPGPEYRLRLLEPEHTVWRIEEPIPADQLRPLYGVNFGCRTSVMYAPPDPPGSPRPALGCLWELSRPGHDKKFSDVVQRQIDAARSLGLNVMAYATNRQVKFKYENFVRPRVARDEGAVDRGQLYIAKLRHGGGWNAAPGALLALEEALIREQRVRVATQPIEIDITDQALFDYHLVFLHGRNDFRFSEDERRQLRTYVERGGMVLADAVCASEAFARAFHREMAAIFAEQPLERIPPDDPLFTREYGGFDLSQVQRRDPVRADDGSLRSVLRDVEPHLEGIMLLDRWAVFFSPFDLSCALESHESVECRGYTREDAARIGLNVILYSLQE